MTLTGPWDMAQVTAHLHQAVIPLRLAVLGRDGGPLVLSLWFLPEADGTLWCATPATARVVVALRRDPRAGFEVAADQPPYRGVRGRGRASLHPERGADILARLLARYGIPPASRLHRTLSARAATEMAICLRPDRLSTWDFSQRMADAVPPARTG
jgi:hypothetical protein